MNRRRDYGQDLPFCDWLRNHEDLPSKSAEIGFVATDVDLAIHRYFSLVDGIGTREIQMMMQLEVKTRRGKPKQSQRDTLYKQHCCSQRQVQFPRQSIRHFGVSMLSMDGTMPEDSTLMRWGRFSPFGRVIWRTIQQPKLIELLRFEVDPDSFGQITFSRNTANGSIVMSELDDRGQPLTVPTFKGV